VGILRARPGLGGGHGQGAHYRVLAVATRVLGRGGFCRHEMIGGDGGESHPKTLRRGVGAVGWSRAYPSSMPTLHFLTNHMHHPTANVIHVTRIRLQEHSRRCDAAHDGGFALQSTFLLCTDEQPRKTSLEAIKHEK
jgi:hypothetical protein